MQSLRVIGRSAAVAFADARAIYTWRTWTFGWLGRMLAQVVFFTYLGTKVGGAEQTVRLVLGNAVMTSVVESLSVVASTGWERMSGTLPLLVAAPTRPVWVFFGRSLQWPVSGTATSLVALFGLAPLFGVSWQAAQVPAVVALVGLAALGSYCFGLLLAALVLRAYGLRNVVSNAAYLLMMPLCGVLVPAEVLPGPARAVGALLPLTHVLTALRGVVAHSPPAAVLVPTGMAVLTTIGWFAAASFAFDVLVRGARRSGTLDLT
ncbi:ABC transporter permease [Umezawaea tangerina]|uniref:ABC-2 type transport system permease protein n=1 Tax=Umezawaea tangerina TaxID=84725 RepID=A0A2T0T4D6_9PSEU|nr:ABC transporter permease [Umezawaea tangerina]PRY40489.1 ABC-2 type transport system permease protein [Umezawaea tangerina]